MYHPTTNAGMPVVLQITFRQPPKDDVDPAAVHAALKMRARRIAHDVPGLLWKIWIARPTANIYGGTYLFESAQAAQAYLDSPIPDDIRHNPDFTTQIFEIEEEFSTITRAPLSRPASS